MATNRNHTVDILRGYAIFFVVFGHVTHLFIDFLCYRTIYEYCGRVVAMGNMCSVNRHGLL